jgi:hypothetical protein
MRENSQELGGDNEPKSENMTDEFIYREEQVAHAYNPSYLGV